MRSFVRLHKYGFVAGAARHDYSSEKNTVASVGRDGGDLRAIVPFGTGTLNETKAFFANIDHRFNEKWSVSAGFRWLEDNKEQPPETFSGNFMFSFIGVPVVIGYQDGGLDEAVDFDKVVGQFSVEYTHLPSLFI